MPRKEDLKRLIEAELARNKTKSGWGGTGVEISLTQFSLTPQQRQQVQDIGNAHGCHTCGTRIGLDPDQPWIGDHYPPTNLPEKMKDGLIWDEVVRLRPQCDDCSNKQAGIVYKLRRSKKLKDLSDDELKLVGCHKYMGGPHFCVLKPAKNTSIVSNGPTVSASEGLAIQTLGGKLGCHTCGARFPRAIYHADHAFPQEFCTNYMEVLFDHLGLPWPTKFELRPQCPRCSGNQGGNMRWIAEEAVAYARDVLGIPVYK